MRLLVNCPSGESRLLQLEVTTKFSELKKLLQDLEGIPAAQQHLVFAGQECKDHLSLEDYRLGQFSLADEAVLYLSKLLAQPKLVYLCSRSKPSQLVPENVEYDMPLEHVKSLLESRGLATTFTANASMYVKRQDGSTVQLRVNPQDSVEMLESQITELEGATPVRMIFMQAQDGCVHIIIEPSRESSTNTYPVYSRSTRPQPVMMVKPPGSGLPLPSLVDELCVLP